MKIAINENNVVTSILYMGDIEGSIEITDEVPNDLAVLKYKYVDGQFVKNLDIPDSDDIIEYIKSEKIAESKTKLAEWLEDNPMLYTDGKYYSVTAEKQSLLNGNLASYERAKTVNVEYPLKWNSTGSECIPWDYTDLLTLSLTIAGYVAPKVSKQQAIELQIKACTTVDELNEIVINYE